LVRKFSKESQHPGDKSWFSAQNPGVPGAAMAGELAPDRGPRTVGISIEHFDKDLTITRYERLPLIANRFF